MGAGVFLASGVPVTRELAVIPPTDFPLQYMGWANDGRLPTYSNTDIFVRHEFRLGASRRLQLSMKVALFNQKTATNRFMTYQDANGITLNEADFYAGKVNVDRRSRNRASYRARDS